MMGKKLFRLEKDSLGTLKIPQDVYWGIQTQRAIKNFPVSGLVFPPEFIKALGLVKVAAAEANLELGLLDKKIAFAILKAGNEVVSGKWNHQFVVDIFQTGSGTSTNMNANEVIANRAIEILGGKKGSKSPVHPNDHVNLCQSSNDVIPTVIHISAVESINNRLIPVLKKLKQELEQKEKTFRSIVKLGRTHLQDATPVLLGQEFGGYAAMISSSLRRVQINLNQLLELALGGTAVGTGINRHKDFSKLVIKRICQKTRLKFVQAKSHFEAQGSRDAVVQVSSTLKTLAVSLTKIANDIRWLSSGPFGGIGELSIPAVQPGSSIMPGKVNPVIVESLLQVAVQVIGNDATITLSGMSGNFELNVMMPVLAYALLQSINLLANSMDIFTRKVIRGIKADEKKCRELLEKSLAMVTALTPVIGYDRAAEVAREAFTSGKSIKTVILEKKLLDEKKLLTLLDPQKMTKPGL